VGWGACAVVGRPVPEAFAMPCNRAAVPALLHALPHMPTLSCSSLLQVRMDMAVDDPDGGACLQVGGCAQGWAGILLACHLADYSNTPSTR